VAIFSDSDSNYLQRAAPWSSITSLTMVYWCRPRTADAWKCPMAVDYDTNNTLYIETDNTPYWHMYESSAGGDIDVALTGLGSVTANTWYFLAVTFEGSIGCVVYGATVDGPIVSVGSSAHTSLHASSDIHIGRNSYVSEFFDGRIAHVKIWDAALSAEEVAQERWSARPRRMADLKAWYPLIGATAAECLADYSPNGLTLSQVGSPTVEDGPPVGWGAGPIFLPTRSEVLQYGRPISDVASGSWTPSTGSDLYAMIDEEAASDSDYIRSAASPTDDTANVGLTALGAPVAGTVRMKVRARIV